MYILLDHITFACLIGCTIYEPIFIKKCESIFCIWKAKNTEKKQALTININESPAFKKTVSLKRGTTRVRESIDSRNLPLLNGLKS